MTPRSILCFASLIVAAACLAGGYALVGQWAGLLACLVVLAAGVIVSAGVLHWKNKVTGRLASGVYAAFLVLAAAGMLSSASPFFMLAGSVAALAYWDLDHFRRQARHSSPSDSMSLLESQHFLSLALALGLGLSLAGAGLVLRFPIPFAVLLLLVVAFFLSLERAVKLLKRN